MHLLVAAADHDILLSDGGGGLIRKILLFVAVSPFDFAGLPVHAENFARVRTEVDLIAHERR